MIRKNFIGMVVNMLNNRIPVLCIFVLALVLSAGGSSAAFAQFVTEKSPDESAPSSALEQAPPPPPPVAAPAAYSGGAMTVTDVIIDKTDKNAVVARDGAIIEAQRSAFMVLAEKSMSPESLKGYKAPDNKTIAALVDSFEIKNEQISANRYVANFTVRFLPDVNNYIKIPEGLGKVVVAGPPVVSTIAAAPAAAAAPTGTAAKPEAATPAVAATPRSVLVLPYYEDAAGRKVLWEDPNPWREAWQSAGSATPSSTLTISVPLGDLSDVSSGNTDAVWKEDFGTVEKSRVNYTATEVALVVAHAGKGIDLYLYKDGKLERLKSLSGKYSDADSYKKAITRVIAALKTPVPFAPPVASAAAAPAQEKTAASPDAEKSPEQPAIEKPAAAAEQEPAGGKVVIEATMSFSNYAQWMEAQKRLASLSPPVDVELSSLTKDQAQFTLDYNGGGMAAFKTALADKGLELGRPVVEVDESVLGSDKPTQKSVYELKLLN